MLLHTLLIIALRDWYENMFFYLFFLELLIIFGIVGIYHKSSEKKNNEIKLIQQQQISKIDNIRKDHSEKLEGIRHEMLKREEERTRQWIESEKETLHVLNGVSNILDLSEKINRVESDKILNILQEIHNKVKKMTEFNT